MTIDITHYTASLHGDREAFGEIVRRNQNLVSAITYSITGNVQESEDLAQETFITAWQRLGELRDVEKLPAWLCGIARNLAHNYLRRTQTERQARTETALENVAAIPCLDETDSAESERESQIALLWATLKEIPMQFREPLVMYYRQNQSVAEIAAALELTEDNVRQRIARGRTFLKKEVERRVEQTLWRIKPGEYFTVGVLAALPIVATGNQVLAASSAGAAASQTASAGGASAGGSFIAGIGTFFWTFFASSILPAIIMGLGIAFGIWGGVRNAPTLRARHLMIKVTLGYIIAGSLFHLLMSFLILGHHWAATQIITISWDYYLFRCQYFLMASVPVLVVIASFLINRKWRKIVEEDSAKAGMECNATTDLRSVYIWGGIALFTFLFAMIVGTAIMIYDRGIVYHPAGYIFFLCFGGIILAIVLPFFYFAVRMSKDQESFAKSPPRLPNLLPILTGEEKAPRGVRNRINFWGDLVGIGWFAVVCVMLLNYAWFDKSPGVGDMNLFLFSLVLLAYFLFAVFFAGIPRRRYWGMIFLGMSVLLIVTCVHVIYLMLTTTNYIHESVQHREHWIAYGFSSWYMLCFTLLGVSGLYAFRKKD